MLFRSERLEDSLHGVINPDKAMILPDYHTQNLSNISVSQSVANFLHGIIGGHQYAMTMAIAIRIGLLLMQLQCNPLPEISAPECYCCKRA
jgi:hypothetical protein